MRGWDEMNDSKSPTGPATLDGPASAWQARAALLETGFFFLFLLAYIWLVEPISSRWFWHAFGVFMGLAILSNRLHGDTATRLGIRVDNLGTALAEAIGVIAPALLVAVGAGLRLGGGPDTGLVDILRSAAWIYPWALFQQYGLQCVLGRRLEEVLPDPVGHDVVCAAMFAALHLPNPFLTVVTFGAGYCFCALFRRGSNIFALAAAQALASTVIYHFLPNSITAFMRVGPGYFLARIST